MGHCGKVYKDLYANKLDIPDEMGKHLKIAQITQTGLRGSGNFNRPKISKQIESLTKNSQQREVQDPMASLVKFYSTFKEKLTEILLKLFQKR